MMNFYKTLILSTGLAALAFSAPLPVTQDPCAILAGLNRTELKVENVNNCYKSIEYNPVEAKATLNSLHTLYNDFFVFRDSALTPNLASPFSSPPVDIIAGLEKINQTPYTNDFDFHSDVAQLIGSLNDAHSSYQQDCAILAINGVNPVAYIQAWADQKGGFSKDPGVRFNEALASHTYVPETQTWGFSFGSFALRSTLPDSSFITYTMQCGTHGPGKGQPLTYRAPWITFPSATLPEYTDKASFVKNVCSAVPAPANDQTASEVKLNPRDRIPLIEAETLTLYKRDMHLQQFSEKQKRSVEKRQDGEPSSPTLRDFPDAMFVDGNVTAVYQLKSKPHVGILVLPTMDVTLKTEVPAVQERLAKLASLGVTNIIIDTSGNGGGLVDFSSALATVFFPTQDKRISSHPARFKVTPAAIALADADLINKDVSTYFEPSSLADKIADKPYTTNPFLNPVNIVINGHAADYTDEVYMDFNLTVVDQSMTYPWTNNASRITILTDGQCGSACGMMSDLLVQHGVKAVGVGGYSTKDLSMFSFAGASVIGLDSIVEAFEDLGVPATLKRLPYKASAQIGIIEVYGRNDVTPLEYNPARHPAAYRLAYTPETARRHDLLWGSVAQTAWGI
ncbi:hypothetical protein BGX27_001452 [Mortierella sp. AM989]|nr:hypothetical protein BGX27_001452 [Mortierella sp. AM989]